MSVSSFVTADLPQFRPTRAHLGAGGVVFATVAVVLISAGAPASRLPLLYVLAEAAAAALAAVCTFNHPRLALALETAVGMGVYGASIFTGIPIWTYTFAADREALQLFFKYVIVFVSGTLVLAAYKLVLTDARRRKYAGRMSAFVGLVLVANMLWTVSYECAYNPLHCWLLRAEAVTLAAWLAGRLVSCFLTETPMVEPSYWRVVERRATAPALIYVSGMLSLEWVLAYTVWNVGFVLEQFTDVVVIQDLTFWTTMLYFRWRDEQPRRLHAYFYEARAVSLGAHMTVSALFGILVPMRNPWISSRGSYESYAPEGTLPFILFVAGANLAVSATLALPACMSAWRAAMLARHGRQLPLFFARSAAPGADGADSKRASPAGSSPTQSSGGSSDRSSGRGQQRDNGAKHKGKDGAWATPWPVEPARAAREKSTAIVAAAPTVEAEAPPAEDVHAGGATDAASGAAAPASSAPVATPPLTASEAHAQLANDEQPGAAASDENDEGKRDDNAPPAITQPKTEDASLAENEPTGRASSDADESARTTLVTVAAAPTPVIDSPSPEADESGSSSTALGEGAKHAPRPTVTPPLSAAPHAMDDAAPAEDEAAVGDPGDASPRVQAPRSSRGSLPPFRVDVIPAARNDSPIFVKHHRACAPADRFP